jgi:predicted S18 family serine protease
MARRKKVSTTISPESYAFLRSLIRSGKAENLAQALDLVLGEIRRADNRARLERATAAYYESASAEAIQEENDLARALSSSTGDILFDE